MKRFALICCFAIVTTLSGIASTIRTFPAINQGGKIAIVAHRGFWKCKQAGFSENSIASLKMAQEYGLWGSECDLHMTVDKKVIVNHDNNIDGLLISEHTFAELSGHKLPNGECRPSFDEYVAQASKCATTKLVVEIKIQPSSAIERDLVNSAVKTLKKYKMFNPDRCMFISFSEYVCQYIAERYPQFTNQFLTYTKKKDVHPSQYAEKGINGVDYKYSLFNAHPEWVAEARKCKMSVNAWTVNKEENIRQMIEFGVDAITTNEPLKVRKLLAEKEFTIAGQRFGKVDSLINTSISKGIIPGAVLYVVQGKGDVIYSKAYGNKQVVPVAGQNSVSMNLPLPMRKDVIFDMASCTKVVCTTTAIMQLWEKGLVDIEKPVGEYLKDFADQEITVKDLLTHTSGISGSEWRKSVDYDLYDTYGEAATDSLVRFFACKFPKIPRNVKYQYSCPNFFLLAQIVENVSRERFCDYVQKNIFDPLGMNDSHFLL